MENEFYFDDQASGNQAELEAMFTLLLSHIEKVMKRTKPFALSVTIVDDPTIHKINKEYRNIDRPTDVISFAYDDDKSDMEEPIDDLGEIIISYQTAYSQAQFYKHPFEREMAFLFIHGFLHLSGYDHVNSEKEAEVMFGLQNDILNSFDYKYKELKNGK